MPVQAPGKRRATQASDEPAKRTRVSRACDQCRTAREKCNGAQPTCSTCSTARRGCTYTATVKKRGIQPGYIRALELALAYLFQNPENETIINEKLAHSGARSLFLSRDSKESNKLHKRWRKARFYADIDRLLSGGEPARRDPSDSSSSDGEEDPSNTEALYSAARGQSPHHAMNRSGLSKSLDSSIPSPVIEPTPVSIPNGCWRLLESYFTYICWFPISEKHDLMKLSYSYPPEGIILSPKSSNGGRHAELWSVLALASVHDTDDPDAATATPARLYAMARSLIPDESGVFELSHVKALLNMAIFNLAHASMVAAWLLVAFASRMLQSLDQTVLAASPRFKHTLYGCFILDSMLALHFERRSCLRLQDIIRCGPIDENGLDEWQPWPGGTRSSSSQASRTPPAALALSTFNLLPHVLDLLIDQDGSIQDKLRQLKAWELSLPPKLVHVCATASPPSLTPSTILLRLTYFCAALGFTSSHTWLLRALNLLEQAQDDLGWKSLTPVLRCLFDYLEKRSATVVSSHEIRSRLDALRAAMNAAWPAVQGQSAKRAADSHAHGGDLAQTTRPTSFIPSIQQPLYEGRVNSTASPLDTAVFDTQSLSTLTSHADRLIDASVSQSRERQHQEIPSNLESFFEELAALDTANDAHTQPLFMQNLGFAPGEDMADIFNEYIPMQSSAFMPQGNPNAVNMDYYSYEGGD